MAAIYPKKIEHTTKDKILKETGYDKYDKGYGTQKLYNPDNIKNGKKTYASWGEDTKNATKCATDYCKAIATHHGTRRQPEEILASNWDTTGIPTGATITNINVEFSYYTAGYSNFSHTVGYFPDDTVITLYNKNGKKITSGKAKGPNKTETERTVKLSSLKLSLSDFKNSKIGIQVGENKSSSGDAVCKVRIRYLRINVKYEDPTPKYQLKQTLPSTARINKEYPYECTVNSTNSYSKKTTFYVQVPKNATLSNLNGLKLSSNKDANFNLYYKNISDKNNKITFTVKSTKAEAQSFKAYLSAYGNNQPKSTVTIQKPTINFDIHPLIADNCDATFTKVGKQYECREEEKCVKFEMTLNRSLKALADEYVDISTNFDIEWENNTNVVFSDNNTRVRLAKDKLQYTLKSKCMCLNEARTYTITAQYVDKETGTKKIQTCVINVKSPPLKKEYFKLRLEDGSDVQYNSLSFSRGDDLKIPLTYDSEDITNIKPENFIIKGETKRIPIGEPEYITFNIELNTEEDYTLENVLAYIEATDDTSADCSDIILGVDNNGTLFDAGDKKYCLIKQLINHETTKLRIAVQSDFEQTATIKLRPYNYDLYPDNGNSWVPGKAIFSEIPNVKIYIDSADSNDMKSGDTITINYYIENKSDVDGEDLKFQLIEPSSFEIWEDIPSELYEGVYFNDQNRVITFTELPANSQRYVFSVTYAATKKGIYDFILNTVDYDSNVEDDQNKNSYSYQVLVDILSDVHIKTLTNKSQPYVNELFDFTIKLDNRIKSQKEFTFDITDIGDYNPTHNIGDNYDGKDYAVEYVDCDFGDFTISTDDNNSIGVWKLYDIPANSEHQLTLSLKPKKAGLHTIHTDFANSGNINDSDGIQHFDNRVKVLEAKKQIDFNVYHAVFDGEGCPDIDDLIEICNEDFISLSDNIYYVFEVTNNSVKELAQNINVYARLPESFLTNDITCYSSDEYKPILGENNLLTIPISQIDGCATVKFFFRVTPSEEGEFVSNFMLSTKTADVLNKQLHLTVDSEFNQREIEHEIKIYNFEKTNKYYRYEIDNNGEIFKFFNQGDKTVRPIETETYDVNAIEVYKGNNLKKIVEDIKENSKYVDPVFLRIGNNKLADKGYELYPDGFIRRFGLLKSEVFHYSNQLPEISNLGERALKWDIDEWDTKVWAGDPYDNGIFDLTIDYSKVPSNFDILSADHPINRLQNIVNKTKPYGTKGICYYSASSSLKFKIDIEDVRTTVGDMIDLALKITDIYLTTAFNRHDNSLTMFYDDINLDFSVDYDMLYDYIFNLDKDSYVCGENRTCTTTLGAEVDSICIYDDIDKRFYIEDCMDIVRNLYNINNNTKSVDITFPYQKFQAIDEPEYLNDYHFLNCINNCEDNQFIGYAISYIGVEIKFGYKREDINNFEGFVLEIDGKEINKRKNLKEVTKFSIGINEFDTEKTKVVHFWGSVNEEEYYHIGFVDFSQVGENAQTVIPVLEPIDAPVIKSLKRPPVPVRNFYTPYIDIFNTHPDNNCQAIHYSHNEQRTLPITFKITDQIKEHTYEPNNIREVNTKKWGYLNNINKPHKHAIFEYNSKVDKECKNIKAKVPRLAFKYDTEIGRLNEIVDIDFTIKAQTNKDIESFMNDLNVNVHKDGDSIYPTGTSSKIYYPQSISNTTKDLLTTYVIGQPNITICTKCLRTTLGYHDKCPHCNSTDVSHQNEVQPVTICETCGWVYDGTHTFCKHCLSMDVNNVDVDYNKTYCNNCRTMFNGYYKYCPKCFKSEPVVYLDNKQQAYYLPSNQQNIDPITIQTDKDEVNIFNIKIPFYKYSDILEEVDSLILNMYFTNNNDREYYYCPECGVGGLGNFDTCPKCGGHVINRQVEYNIFNTYIKVNNTLRKVDLTYKDETNNIIGIGSTVRSIDLLSLSKEVEEDSSFELQFWIKNPHIKANIQNIMALDIDDKYLEEMLNKLNTFDFSVDNLTVDCSFKNNNNWLNLDALDGADHTGLVYKVNPDETYTEPLEIFDFNIPASQYTTAYLNLSGLCKTNSSYDIILTIVDRDNKEYKKEINQVSNQLFNYDIDLVELMGRDLRDLKVEVVFNNINDTDEIVITNCDILTTEESTTFKDKNMEDQGVTCIRDNNTYLIKSNNLWNLNETAPEYLSGKQLETNLLCYLDFGELESSEYIRLYDVYMTVYYKTKIGKITTDTIEVLNERNTEQYIDGQIVKENGEIWGSIKETEEALNNLEYEKLNIDEEGNINSSIPLYSKIAQSFVYPSDNISQINLRYFGRKGYPSDIILVSLYDNYNNRPNNLIAQNTVMMPSGKTIVNIDFDVSDITPNATYWITIEDSNADLNNYHRFNFNDNVIGTLIKNQSVTNKESLAFSIDSSDDKQSYHDLPVEWTVSVEREQNTETEDDEEPTSESTVYFEGGNDVPESTFTDYKLTNTFYRYNIDDTSNAYLSNIIIKNGYYYEEADNDASEDEN